MIKKLYKYPSHLNNILFKYFAILIILLCFLTWSFSFLYSLTWIDKPFPGFLFHKNLAVSYVVVEIKHPSNNKRLQIYKDKLIAIDGERMTNPQQVFKNLSRHKIGTFIDFSILRDNEIFEYSSPLLLFNIGDYLSIFGLSYIVGLICIVLGSSIYFLRPSLKSSKIFFLLCCCIGIWFVCFFDSQSTYKFNMIYILGAVSAPAFLIYLGIDFPKNNSIRVNSDLLAIPLILISITLFLIDLNIIKNQEVLYNLNKTLPVYFILGVIIFTLTSILTYKNPTNKLEKQRSQIVLTGTLIGLVLPSSIFIGQELAYFNAPWNLIAFLFLAYPISISYAILKHKLFDLNVIIKKALVYGFLTGLLGGIIAILIITFNLLLANYGGWKHPIFFIILSAFLAVALNPLQNRIQAFIDLVFFRKKFDYRKTVEEISYAMTSILNPYDINKKIVETIEKTIFAKNIYLFLFDSSNNCYKLYAENSYIPKELKTISRDNPLIRHLEKYRNEIFLEDLITERRYIDDSSELKKMFNDYESSLFIPLLSKEKLIGVLSLGDKKSFLSYTSEDLELLRILANQSSIAIENALAFTLIEDYAKKLEETNIELRETQAQLIQSEKMSAIGQLATGIAHEIRNPLNIIEGARYYLSHLLTSTEKTDAVNEYLDYIKQEVERTNKLIGSLLKFSKSDSPKFELVDINNTLDSTLVLLKKQLADGLVNYYKDYEPALPKIYGDSNQLWQVFVNIIMNAIQAMPHGGDLIIKTFTNGEDNSIWISFKDTGVGMDQEDVKKIFDPFFTRKESGTGLGLSICYNIIENHRGGFKVESEKGEGTVFQVYLPIKRTTDTIEQDQMSEKEDIAGVN